MDCSGAAYKTAARPLGFGYLSPLAPRGEREGKPGISGAPLCRLELNDPPTAVGGIPGVFAQSRQWVDCSGAAYKLSLSSRREGRKGEENGNLSLLPM